MQLSVLHTNDLKAKNSLYISPFVFLTFLTLHTFYNIQ